MTAEKHMIDEGEPKHPRKSYAYKIYMLLKDVNKAKTLGVVRLEP